MSWTAALPAIASFLGGPVGGLAAAGVQFLADKLGAKEATVDAIKSTLQGWTPEQLLAQKKLDLEFQMFAMDNGIKIDLAQIEANKEESRTGAALGGWKGLFIAGWRPAVGWICAMSLFYAAILEPAARFIAAVVFGYKGVFPVIDTFLTLQVLFGILGLGAMRTREKEKKVEHFR